MGGKASILILALLLAAMVPSTLLALPITPAQDTLYEVTMNDTYLPAGQEVVVQFVIKNFNDELSLEQVNFTLPFATDVTGVEAKAYNSTTQSSQYFIGTWSYETKTTDDGYKLVRVYTSTLPLQTNYMLVVNLTVQTVTTPGSNSAIVELYHYLGGTAYQLVDTRTIDIIIDNTPPTASLPSEYVAGAPTETGDVYTILVSVADTIDGSAPGQLSVASIESIVWHDDNGGTDTTLVDGTDYTWNFDSDTGYITIVIENSTIQGTYGTGLETGDTLTISVAAIDEAGNDGSAVLVVTVDNQDPQIEFIGVYYSFDADQTPPYSDEAYNDGTDYWVKTGESAWFVFSYNENMHVSHFATAGPSGVTIVRTGDLSGYFAVYVENINSDTSVTVTIYDGAMNANYATGSVKVDGTAPSLTVSYTVDTTTIELEQGQIERTHASSVTLTVNADDGTGSGVNTISYTVTKYSTLYEYENDQNGVSYDSGTLANGGTITLGEEGVFVVEITVSDNVGNEATYTYIVLNDVSNPIITVTYDGIDANDYSNQDSVTVTVQVEDTDSVTITVKLDGSEVTSATITPEPGGRTWSYDVTFDETLLDGSHTIEVVVVDGSGNSDSDSKTFTLDRTDPYVDDTASTLDDLDGTYLDPASDSLSGETIVFKDDTSGFTSGIASLVVKFDGSELPTDYYSVDFTDANTLTITISDDGFWTAADVAEGAHTLEFIVSDNAGNAITYTFTFYKDVQSPSIDYYAVVDSETGVSGYTSGTIEVTVQASDTVRLSDTVTIKIIHPTEGEVYSETFTLTLSDDQKSGSLTTTIPFDFDAGVEYTVTVIVSDYYGHTSSSDATVQLDNVAPEILYDGEVISYPPDEPGEPVELGCLTTLDSIVLTVSDTGVGVATVSVTLNGAEYTDYTLSEDGTLTINVAGLEDGSYTFVITVTDYAGNSAEATVTVTIDSVLPEVAMGDTSLLTGGVEISGVSMTDNVGVTSASITVVVDGVEYAFDGLSPNIFSTGMYVLTPDGLFEAETFEQLQYMIGENYAAMANPDDPVDYPVLVLIDGKIYLIPGLYSEDVEVSITFTAYDCAGNEGEASATFTVPAGQFVLFKLYEGWNLVSLPVMADNLKTSGFVEWIEGDGDVVIYLYDKANGTWMDPYIPGVSTTDYELKDGVAFWVYYQPTSSDSAMVVAQGYLPYTTPPGGTPPGFVEYYLTEGGNFLGFTSAAALPIGYYLSYLIDTNMIYEWVYIFNPATQSWNVVSVETMSDRLIYPGTGMWVIVYQDTPFNVLPWYSWYSG